MIEHTIPTQRKHLPALDAVRGVAILSVFLVHLLTPIWGGDHLAWGSLFHHLQWPADRNMGPLPHGFLWFYPLSYGWVGVSLFFVLSGFVIHYSTVSSSRPFSTSDFYMRRFWRIYPPYALAVLIFTVFPSPAYPATRLAIITHFLLVQDFSGQTFYMINPAFWSIATEVQFYLVYPLLILARGRVGMFKVLMGVLSFSVLCRVLICLAKFRHPEVFEDTHKMTWASPMITIFDWTLGAYLAECLHAGKRVFPKNAGFAGLVVGLFLLSSFVRPLSTFSFQLASLMSAVWIERVLWSTRPLSIVQKLLIPLGLCSYSFYLIHQPLLDRLATFSQERFATDRYVTTLVAGPVIFCLIYGLSWVVYLLVEKTSINTGKRFSSWLVQRGRTQVKEPNPVLVP
jgi:peptidoglycan/LPS O-acetylase OafA/YrhL